MQYLYLLVAIVGEAVATSFMKQSDGFTKFWPTLAMGTGYIVAFYFLSLTLRIIPTGIAYAIWAGLGIVLITVIAWLFHGQKLDAAAIVGMGFIVCGVVIMNAFSGSISH